MPWVDLALQSLGEAAGQGLKAQCLGPMCLSVRSERRTRVSYEADRSLAF